LLETVLFFINILKIAVSAKLSVIIRFQRSSYFCVAISPYSSTIFVEGCKFWFCSPAKSIPSLRYWFSHSSASAEKFSGGGGQWNNQTEIHTN